MAIALGGCGGGGIGDGGDPNATDAAFARAMSLHQRRTGDIAKLASRQARRRELRTLADATLARNGDYLRGLTEAADEIRRRGVSPAGGNVGEPPPYDPRSAGSSDLEFLQQLIRQNEFALKAAAAERARGGYPELKILAAAIEKASRRDLEKLKRWRRTWYGGDPQPGAPPVPPPGGGGSSPNPGPEV